MRVCVCIMLGSSVIVIGYQCCSLTLFPWQQVAEVLLVVATVEGEQQ